VPVRSLSHPIRTGAAGLLLAGGAATLLAPAATAAPSSTPAPSRPGATLPVAPSSSPALAPRATTSAAPSQVAVPAGGGASTHAARAGFGPTEIALSAAGLVLVAGGALALRRQYR